MFKVYVHMEDYTLRGLYEKSITEVKTVCSSKVN